MFQKMAEGFYGPHLNSLLIKFIELTLKILVPTNYNTHHTILVQRSNAKFSLLFCTNNKNCSLSRQVRFSGTITHLTNLHFPTAAVLKSFSYAQRARSKSNINKNNCECWIL